MNIKKLISLSLISVLGLSTLTACSDAEKATADQAAKDIAYLRAQKEKEVAEKEANIKKSLATQEAAREYQKKHPAF